MQFNGINSQIFLHKNSGFDETTITKLQQLTGLTLYKLEDWHQEYKSSLTPIIIISYNDKEFNPLEYENRMSRARISSWSPRARHYN